MDISSELTGDPEAAVPGTLFSHHSLLESPRELKQQSKQSLQNYIQPSSQSIRVTSMFSEGLYLGPIPCALGVGMRTRTHTMLYISLNVICNQYWTQVLVPAPPSPKR